MLRVVAPLVVLLPFSRVLPAQSSCGTPTGEPLSFPGGNYGSQGFRPQSWWVQPNGGTPPYTFSYTPGTTPFPGFQVLNAPDLPPWFPSQVTGGLVGNPLPGTATNTPFTSSVRLTDCAGTIFDQNVTLTFWAADYGFEYFPQAWLGQSYNFPLTALGGTPPYTFSLADGALPDGLNLMNNTIVGTPTAAGTFNFTLQLQDSAGSSLQRGYSMQVPVLTFNGYRSLPNGAANVPYSYQLPITGGTPPYNFTISNAYLPSGITVSASGLVSGTTGDTGGYPDGFTANVTDSASPPNTLAVRVVVTFLDTTPVPIGPTVSCQGAIGACAMPGFTTGGPDPYFGFYFYGGVPPYSYSVTPGSQLPGGLYLIQGDGLQVTGDFQPFVLGGAVRTPGDYAFSIRVTDAAQNQYDQPYTLHVTPLGLINSYFPLSKTPHI
jgi:hypothetical protein